MAKSDWRTRLLWIDGIGALAVGLLMLALRPLLAGLYGLSPSIVAILALVNLAYASYSLTLAARSHRSLTAIAALAVANGAWTLACAALAGYFAGSASALGLTHFALEGLYVGVLGLLEWQSRHLLAR